MAEKIAAIILAAGKGKRLKEFRENKVLIKLFGRPLILYPVEVFLKMGAKIFVVVGFGKEGVQKALGQKVSYVEQKEQLGTAHALICAMSHVKEDIDEIMVVMGDHGFSLGQELLTDILKLHRRKNADLTLLTVLTRNPLGYGLVLRDGKKSIKKILDGKHSYHGIGKRYEITPGVYCFKQSFLKNYLHLLPKHKSSGEYYLSDMVELAYQNHKKVESLISPDKRLGIGINTIRDLKRMKKLFKT